MNMKQIIMNFRKNFDNKTTILCFATILLVGLYGLPWFMENVYYDSAKEIEDKTNSDVKFIGHVIWIDEYDDNYPGFDEIYIEYLSTETDIIIISNNNKIEVGDDVIIKGFYFQEGYEGLIASPSTILEPSFEPEAAKVQEVWWHHGSYSILKGIAWLALIYSTYLVIISGKGDKDTEQELSSEKGESAKPSTEEPEEDIELKKMFCTKCGKQIDPDSKFCNTCGRKVT